MTITITDLRHDKSTLVSLTQRVEIIPPIGYRYLPQVTISINDQSVLVDLNELRAAIQALS